MERRCVCGKVIHRNRHAALTELNRLVREHRDKTTKLPRYTYRCKRTGHYHLTSKERSA